MDPTAQSLSTLSLHTDCVSTTSFLDALTCTDPKITVQAWTQEAAVA